MSGRALPAAPGVAPPQLTARALALGVLLSALLAGANAYLGLFAGLTVSASIPAAVISMAVLKALRGSTVLENNIVQTVASAGESLAAGSIFTFPALVLIGYWRTFDYAWIAAIAGLGGLLGVLFAIPLRRSLVVEQGLAFPEGTATAEVLKLGARSRRGAVYLAAAAVAGALIKLCETGLHLWGGTAESARYLGERTVGYVGANLSPALLGVGYIVGPNVAVVVFLGGAIAWYAAIPIYSTWLLDGDPALAALHAGGASAAELAYAIWSEKIRYLGVGAMLVGGVTALAAMRGSLAAVFRRVRVDDAARSALAHTERDAPLALVAAGVVLFAVPIFAVYHAIVGSFGIAAALTAVMLLAAFLFSAVGGYMAGLVGSSNNPISGITIATILLTATLLWWLMGSAGNGAAAALMVGAVVCCAGAIAGDTFQDLRAGYLLGATPWRQQLAQALGVVAATLVMAPILNLLLAAYGIGPPDASHPSSLAAPQATLMASVARGVFEAELPWALIGVGALIGTAIAALDAWLVRGGAAWRAPVLAVAVGIYLPLELTTPILAGGLLAHFANRKAAGEAGARHGVLYAAGLITGEALAGILLAVPIAIAEDPDVLALPLRVPMALGIAIVAATGIGLYAVATRRSQ